MAEHLIHLTQKPPVSARSNQTKAITVFEYTFSNIDRNTIYQNVQGVLDASMQYWAAYAVGEKHSTKRVQLGMGKVPVLDQGKHGTCTTFAVTAALDAALKKGDYISQLCLLQLGNHFENEGNGKSGWRGIGYKRLLSRIDNYGVMNMKKQHAHGCGGLKTYPYYQAQPTEIMSPEQYLAYSQKISGARVTWQLLFDRFPMHATQKNANMVKDALDSGHRVVFGTLLPRVDLGTMGAVGWHHYFKDTWVLTDEIATSLSHQNTVSAHAMIITGYDDTAVAMDKYGRRHRGLFTVRNSWGAYVADWGDFYMTYDYFNALVMEAYAIQAL
ncbi:MAG: C1 family peptidase [Legionellaceae bacterium]|nr:C1 family peptidase [Legionellaceae bacterium]